MSIQAEGLGQQSLGQRPRSGRREVVVILFYSCSALKGRKKD
jgi:hypothetical protein